MLQNETFENSSALITLNLSSKNLFSFNDLKKYKNLIELDLSENNFNLPIPNISLMKFLKRLNLSYNQINEFWIFPENIEILLLNSNSISFCNDNLHNLKNLTTLDLSYNLLCDISSLSEIITLKYLFLKNNQISSSSPLQKLVNLYELDLESNVISEFSDLKNWDNHNSISILNMKGNPVISYIGNGDQEENLAILENLPYVKGAIFAKSNKHFKNSMTLLNNNKRNITNKSAINRSLMQIKQDYSSSFSEVNTSEEDDHIANSTKNEEFFNNPNSYLIETKNNPFENEILKIKQSNDNPPPIPKVPKLFLNTSIGNIQNIAPLKKNNTTQSYSLEKNLSLQISMPNNTQINQTIIDETNIHLPLENTTNSPKIFNKTMEKFKCFLNDNEQNKKKIFEKYQNIDGIQFKKYEKKNLSALFNKEDKEQEEQNHKHTTEALIKKNHELQMENYNLRKCLNVEKNFFNSKFKKLYDVIKLHIDKNLDARSKFDLADIDFLTEVLDKYINKGLNFETKEKVLHQFDNLRDYYRKKIENLTMNINELESQIAFQIKPIIQTQQQTIEFYKSRYQKFSCYSETQNLKKSDSKHIRTKSLNTTKFNRHQEFLQKTEKMKVYLPEVNTINSQKMEKYVDLIKATVNNLNFEIISYKKNKETGIKDNKSYKLKKKKH